MDRSQGASPGVLTFDSLHSSGAGVITATDLDFDRLEALDYWGASEMWPSEVTHCPAKKKDKERFLTSTTCVRVALSQHISAGQSTAV